MNAQHWQRIDALYHEASTLAPGDRARFLDESCAGDALLRAEVESLLRYEPGADTFIDTSAFDVAARLMTRHWSADHASLSGTTLGSFRVLEKIGEGGMGVVYEAEDTRLRRKVALKFLPAWIGSDPEARARFEHEARAASALNHPNICTIYSVQDHDGQPCIEMERLYGETLRDRLARQPLSVDEAVTLTDQLLDGLDAAHAKGIVHRDLKPANIFCTDRGAKILDFGIATANAGQDERAGTIIGTVSYMSPEQAAGRPVDARTDLFSLGVVMREMLIGKIPKALDRVMVKARQDDRDRRYQSTAEMRHDLTRFRQRASTRRTRMLAAALLFVVVVVPIALWYSPLNFLASPDFLVRQLTHNASDYGVGSGAMSPDGRYAAYEDPGGLHVLEIETGETRTIPGAGVLPPGTRWELPAAWLPDSTRFIVNSRSSGDTSGSAIWIAGVATPPRKIREHAEAWSVSPDGAWIAFSTEGSDHAYRNAWVIDPDGRNERKLFDAKPGTTIGVLVWSPGSNRIAYRSADDSAESIAAIETRDLDGGAPSTIVKAAGLSGMAWLRDGRMLYSLHRTADMSAGAAQCTHWQMPVDRNTGRPTGAATQLAGWLPQCVGALGLTADGKRASFLQSGLQDAIDVVDLDVDGNPSASIRLTFSPGRNILSGWTADNQSVVFVSDGLGRTALVRQSVGADSPQTIADDPGITGAARLTPDGAAVLYVVAARWPGTAGRLMRVAVGGGPQTEIVSGRFLDGGARCAVAPATLCATAERSGDGRQIVFRSIEFSNAPRRELARADVDSDDWFRWALSPDGTRIAFLDTREPRIHVVSLAGVPPLDVDLKRQGGLGYFSWTSDGKGLLVPSIDPKGAALLSIDLRGNVRLVAHHAGAMNISGLSSPDGRRVAVWVRSLAGSLWVAEIP